MANYFIVTYALEEEYNRRIIYALISQDCNVNREVSNY